MSFVLGERLRAAFAPPRYLALPLSGVDLSTDGVKVARLVEGAHGLILAGHAEVSLPAGAYADGEIVDRTAIIAALVAAAHTAGISATDAALPESKEYLFETTVRGENAAERRVAVEQHLDELVPLPPPETAFDIIAIGQGGSGETRVAGIGFARRIVDETLSLFDQAGIRVQSLEGETFSMARALLPQGDTSTTLIIDLGRTAMKLSIVAGRIPRFATTVGIGGHALTLAVQKYFGVTGVEARKVKVERGIVPESGNEEYIAAMLSTVSAIRDEISRWLDYWRGKVRENAAHESVARVILVGDNAAVRGLPEYFERSFGIPVVAGDVFTNLASRDTWTPPLEYVESLAYATAIGLALRDHSQLYA